VTCGVITRGFQETLRQMTMEGELVPDKDRLTPADFAACLPRFLLPRLFRLVLFPFGFS
jgi:hypothetical protein